MSNESPCTSCGRPVPRGHGDITCGCGAEYNSFGQRLRGDWRSNPSLYDDEIGDLEGYEISHANDY